MMEPKTQLQVCANHLLNTFIHIDEVIELNTIRRLYKDNKELFKYLSEDINKNLDIVIKNLYSLYENPCSKIYTNQTIQIEYTSTTLDSILDEIMEYIDLLPIYTYDYKVVGNIFNKETGEGEEVGEEAGEEVEFLEPYSSDPYYPIEIFSRESLYYFIDSIEIIKEEYSTMKVSFNYPWITKKELKYRSDYKSKNVKNSTIEFFISILNRMKIYNKIAHEYRYAMSSESYQYIKGRFEQDYTTLLNGTNNFIEKFKEEEDVQDLIDFNKIEDLKTLFTHLDLDNYDQTKEIIQTAIEYFSDFTIYANRENVIKEIEKKLEKGKEERVITRVVLKPGEHSIIGVDIPIHSGEATLSSYDIQTIDLARVGNQKTLNDALDWYINYHFNEYLEDIKKASTEEYINKYGLGHFASRLKAIPFIAPVYKYEFALMNPYEIGWDFGILPLPFVRTDKECKEYNGTMFKYDNNKICIIKFGEIDQHEWKDEVDNAKGGHLKPIIDKIVDIVGL